MARAYIPHMGYIDVYSYIQHMIYCIYSNYLLGGELGECLFSHDRKGPTISYMRKQSATQFTDSLINILSSQVTDKLHVKI